MSFAMGQNYRVAVNTETVWGTPLVTGAKFLRINGSALKSNITFTQSQEVSHAHREVADTVATDAMGGGTLDTELTYAGANEDLWSSLFGAAYTGTTVRQLRVGKLRRSLTIQEELSDLTTNAFVSYQGAVVTSWDLAVQRGQIITSQFAFLSRRGVISATTAIGTPAAANTNTVMDPIGSVQVLTEGGGTIVGAQSFSLKVASEIHQIPNLVSVDPADLLPGRFTVTGSFVVAKQNVGALTKFINRTKTTLAITLGGTTLRRIALTMEQVTLTDVAGPMQGMSPIMETVSFQATYDATQTSLQMICTD